jgi:hypothetical protein
MDLSREHLTVVQDLKKWKVPAQGLHVESLDTTGSRVTLTRAVMTGFLAFALKKKTGDVTLILVAADGTSRTVKVKPKHAEKALAWAFEFNVWSETASVSP